MLLGFLKIFQTPPVAWLVVAMLFAAAPSRAQENLVLSNARLSVAVNSRDGAYQIRTQGQTRPVLVSRVAAEVNHHWILSKDFPRHQVSQSGFADVLGSGRQVTVTFAGLPAAPELAYTLRLYDKLPYGYIVVKVINDQARAVTVQAIRTVDAIGEPRIDLGGAANLDRVLSDSFSEDRPPVHIYDLGHAPDYLGMDEFGESPSQTYLGIGSQLVYNRESGGSLFLAALTSSRWLTLLHLRTSETASEGIYIASYRVESTGTTEIQKHESLRKSPADDQIELSLPLRPDEELASEKLMFAAGRHYHAQLEAYSKAIRVLHHARVSEPPLMGWWSWSVFYAGITGGEVLTNVSWLSGHLKDLGYDYALIDEGYQYARGEYTTPNATQFPHGMRRLGQRICRLGIKLGLWTAPFEVSERAWVYQHHRDWLVHNGKGEPIRIVQPGMEPLYVLDTTNPEAQKYLYYTYRAMVHEWGARYIKLDFMDDTAIEGYYYRPHTTALEAQRIGLETIRKAVGEQVQLDKDGSPMLNPVGIVNEGRISLDTSHSFRRAAEVAPGIAARYYMNHNFYESDPDAFEVSEQIPPGSPARPMTLNEAEVSITLAAVAGGMFEIGDDMTLFASEPDRLALLKNSDLLNMIQLQRAAKPLDLMSYRPEDQQPSVFFLREDRRQAMLAVFNWTGQPRSHIFRMSDLQLPEEGDYRASDVFNRHSPVGLKDGVLRLEDQPPHTVHLIKIVDASIPPAAPRVQSAIPAVGKTGQTVSFSAASQPEGVPALTYLWSFGDGTDANGKEVVHTYTRAGKFDVRLTVQGVDAVAFQKTSPIRVTGQVTTKFDFSRNRRYVGSDGP
ncbi:MAG: PKD domain-containing protein [Terriglobia bacterium]